MRSAYQAAADALAAPNPPARAACPGLVLRHWTSRQHCAQWPRDLRAVGDRDTVLQHRAIPTRLDSRLGARLVSPKSRLEVREPLLQGYGLGGSAGVYTG